jgi:cysteine-rich repeat protein
LPEATYACAADAPGCPAGAVCLLPSVGDDGVCGARNECFSLPERGVARPVGNCTPCEALDDDVPTGFCLAGTCMPATCDSTCRIARCGDSCLDEGEACDDGNAQSGDGCRNDCGKIEVCGDGVVDAAEQCDDGNDNDADLCSRCLDVLWGPPFVPAPIASGLPAGMTLDVRTADHCVVACIDDVCRTLGTCGAAGNLGPHLLRPSAAALSPQTRAIYIADAGNHRIVRARGESDGDDSCASAVDGVCDEPTLCTPGSDATDCDRALEVVVGNGDEASQGNGKPARALPIIAPTSLAIDRFGNLFFTSADSLRAVANVTDAIRDGVDVDPEDGDRFFDVNGEDELIDILGCTAGSQRVSAVEVVGDELLLTVDGIRVGCARQ